MGDSAATEYPIKAPKGGSSPRADSPEQHKGGGGSTRLTPKQQVAELERQLRYYCDRVHDLSCELIDAQTEIRRLRLGLPARAEQETKAIPNGKCYCACKACVYCYSRLEQAVTEDDHAAQAGGTG